MSIWNDFMKEHGKEEYEAWEAACLPLTERIADLERQLATQVADIKTLEENYDGLAVTLTSIAKLCGKEWDSGYDEVIVVTLVATQAQALKEAEERCNHWERQFENKEAQFIEMRAECDSLRSQLEAAQQKLAQRESYIEALVGSRQEVLGKLVQPTVSKTDSEGSAGGDGDE